MSHMDYIHTALKELYPGVMMMQDYIWSMDYSVDPPAPKMTLWNEAKLGPLDMQAIENKSLEIYNRPPPAPTTPAVVAIAELTVADGELLGIDTSIGLGAAFFLDIGLIWVMFSKEQDSPSYLPFVQCPGFNADVTAREVDYFEVTVTDRTTNQPAMPGSVSISVQRVK